MEYFTIPSLHFIGRTEENYGNLSCDRSVVAINTNDWVNLLVSFVFPVNFLHSVDCAS